MFTRHRANRCCFFWGFFWVKSTKRNPSKKSTAATFTATAAAAAVATQSPLKCYACTTKHQYSSRTTKKGTCAKLALKNNKTTSSRGLSETSPLNPTKALHLNLKARTSAQLMYVVWCRVHLVLVWKLGSPTRRARTPETERGLAKRQAAGVRDQVLRT